MVTYGRFAASLALLVVMPLLCTLHALAAAPRVHRDPTLQEVEFKGIQNPEGRVLDDNTQIECKVYDPKKPDSTQAIAHAIGTAGATEFDVPVLNNEYTHDTLNGCKCSIEIHGKGSAAWDVTPYLVFKFYNGTTANVGFQRIKLGSGDGYKKSYDVVIDGL